MPPSPENNDSYSLQQAVNDQATLIQARRATRRQTRAAALEAHPSPISAKIQLTGLQPVSDTATGFAPATTHTTQTAGYLLAVGDSWFDYPIHDVLTKLDDNFGYNIESAAHKGDSIESIVSPIGQFDKFSRCMDKIIAVGATPKAILVSGGGDDIAGEEFGMLINNSSLSIRGWNEQVVAGVIDTRIAACYRKAFLLINTLCQQDLGRTVPIFVHGYDHPVPDGRGFLGGWGPLPGPWLKPGFDEKLFNDLVENTAMMVVIIDRFNDMLQALVQEPGFENVHYVDLRGTLSNAPANYKNFWANELHPTGGELLQNGDGFADVAAKFQEELMKLP